MAAERFGHPALSGAVGQVEAARAALDAIETIGNEREREQTAKELVAALAESRRAENRPF